MPKGVYDRSKPKVATLTASEVIAAEATFSRTTAATWRAFDTCRAELANITHAERRAVLGALAGWFNDGKYD